MARLTRRPDRCSSATASISTSVPLMWRNSPTLTMSAASALGRDRRHLGRADAVRHHAHDAARCAGHRLIGVAGERAFEQEQLGAAAEIPLDRAIDHAAQGVAAVMQRAAVRRVDPNGRGRRHQPRKGAALGAVPVQHIGIERGEVARHANEAHQVGGAQFAPHGHPRNAKLHVRRDCRKRSLRARAAGRAVADDADVMPKCGLAACDVDDVTEHAADRGAGDVHDLQGFEIGHGQNQRSETSTVSPGRSG